MPHEKLMIARLLLEDLKVDRVAVASARVSDGEFEACLLYTSRCVYETESEGVDAKTSDLPLARLKVR